MALIFRELGKAVCLKSILLSLFLCASALAQWDTNAWTGAYFRVLPDGTPTLHQLKTDVILAIYERQIAFNGASTYTNFTNNIYRSFDYTIDDAKSAVSNLVISSVNTNIVAGATSFEKWTAESLLTELAYPTNYFDVSYYRFQNIPPAYATNFPTATETYGDFTQADYGWYSMQDILNAIVIKETTPQINYTGNAYSNSINTTETVPAFYQDFDYSDEWTGVGNFTCTAEFSDIGSPLSSAYTSGSIVETDTAEAMTNLFSATKGFSRFIYEETSGGETLGTNYWSGDTAIAELDAPMLFKYATNYTFSVNTDTNFTTDVLMYQSFTQPTSTVTGVNASLNLTVSLNENDCDPRQLSDDYGVNLVWSGDYEATTAGTDADLPLYGLWYGVTNLIPAVTNTAVSGVSALTNSIPVTYTAPTIVSTSSNYSDSVTGADGSATVAIDAINVPSIDIEAIGRALHYYNVTGGFDYQ